LGPKSSQQSPVETFFLPDSVLSILQTAICAQIWSAISILFEGRVSARVLFLRRLFS
jgi:hypothetical protein